MVSFNAALAAVASSWESQSWRSHRKGRLRHMGSWFIKVTLKGCVRRLKHLKWEPPIVQWDPPTPSTALCPRCQTRGQHEVVAVMTCPHDVARWRAQGLGTGAGPVGHAPCQRKRSRPGHPEGHRFWKDRFFFLGGGSDTGPPLRHFTSHFHARL